MEYSGDKSESEFEIGEDRLRELLDASASYIYIKNLDGKYIYYNRRCEGLIPERLDSMYGRTDHDLFPVEIADKFRGQDQQIIRTGERIEEREVISIQTGDKSAMVETSTVKFPMYDQSGKIVAVGGIACDVSEFIRVEEEYHSFRAVLEHANDGLIIVRGDNILFCNKSFTDILGYTEEESKSVSIKDLVEPDDYERVMGYHRNRMLGDENAPRNYEVGIIRKNGDHGRAEINAAKVLWDGKPASLILLTDVTKIYQVASELRNTEERYRYLIENTGDGIVVVDPEGYFLFCNDAFLEICGYAWGECRKMKCLDLVSEEDLPWVIPMYEKAMEDSPKNVEMRLKHKSGETKWVRLSAKPLEWNGGDAALTVLSDITEHKELQNQLIVSERLAAVGTLASGIAHEFNNINVSVLGFSEMALNRDELDPELRDWIERIRNGARRATAITRNVLAFADSDVSMGGMADLNVVAREAVGFVMPEMQKNKIEIELELGDVPPVLMDSGQITQVLINFFINAGHALIGVENKRVVLKTGVKENSVFASVSDNGCGIADEDLRKIFSPFFSTKGEHAKHTPQASVRGSGLGLSVSHRIITNHGGNITVESSPGKGSTFTFSLLIEPDELYLAKTGKKTP